MGSLLKLVAAWLAVSPVVALAAGRMARQRRVPDRPPARGPVAADARILAFTPRPGAGAEQLEESLVVLAHGLSSSCDVVIGAAEILRAGWDHLAPDQRDEILTRVIDQADVVRHVLADVTDGLAEHVRQALEEIQRPLRMPLAGGAAARRP
jgi:hypothetical protein